MARVIATGSVRLNVDASGLARQVRSEIRDATRGLRERHTLRIDVDRASRALSRIQAQSRALLSGLFSGPLIASAARALRDYGAAAALAAPAVIGLANGVATAGQSLALLPGIAAAATAGIAALVIGFQGFGDALGEMDDLEAFNEQLENLAPNAQDAARTIRGLRGPFRELRLDVQQELFRGVSDSIAQLASATLPDLSAGLSGIARQLSRGFNLWADYTASAEGTRNLRTILNNTEAALVQLGPAGRDFAAALADIAAVGSSFLAPLSQSLAGVAERFREFIAEAEQSGRLEHFIAQGIEAVERLGGIVANVAGSIRAVFSGLTGQTGLQFLGMLEGATARMEEFLKSAEGQDILNDLGEVLRIVGGLLQDVLGEALRQLVPVIQELLPFLKTFAAELGDILVSALQVVGPLLQDLARFLSENQEVLAPLVAAFTAVGAVMGFVAKNWRILVNLFKINPFVLVITTLISLVVLVIQHWTTIVEFLRTTWQGISDTATTVWNGIKNFFANILQGISDTATTVWNGIKNFITNTLTGIRDFFVTIWDGISSTARNVWNSIKNFFTSIWGSIGRFFSNTWNDLKRAARRGLSRINDAVGDGISNVLDFFKELPGNVLDAIGDFGTLLYNAGRDLLIGLADGIASMVGNLFGQVRDFAAGLVNEAKSFLGISSPSTVFRDIGRNTGEGLVRGLADSQSRVNDAARKLASGVEKNARPRLRLTGRDGMFGSDIRGAVGQQGGTFVQNNSMLPGADVQQFADAVMRRAAGNFQSGGATRGVSRGLVQIGVNDQRLEGVSL